MFKKNKADVGSSLNDTLCGVIDDLTPRIIASLIGRANELEKKVELLADHLGVEIVEEPARTVIKKKKRSK